MHSGTRRGKLARMSVRKSSSLRMKALPLGILTLLGILLSGVLTRATAAGQETGGQEETEDDLDSLPLMVRHQREERRKLETGLQGEWLLVHHEDPLDRAEDRRVQGWATFRNGYMTLLLQGSVIEPGFFATNEALYFDTGAYRYRIDERLRLQTVSILGCDNTVDGEIQFSPPSTPDEYVLHLDRDELRLITESQKEMTFRRMTETEFPLEAIRALDALRGR